MSASIAQTIVRGSANPQTPAKVAVVIPTTLRASLERAVRSVYAQSLDGSVQILIGIDTVDGDPRMLDPLLTSLPKDWSLIILNPGYSTSVRHGGLQAARDGGVLRTTMSYLANSRYVAYLDDDNWWDPDHLETLLSAIAGQDWAFSLRWYADPQTLEPICIDEWESVGPGAGTYAAKAGGFVDPSSLMIDKLRCEEALRWWSIPLANDQSGMSADRNVFQALSGKFNFAGTGKATSNYAIDPNDPIHARRSGWIQGKLESGTDAKSTD